jgi:hypothetical protein
MVKKAKGILVSIDRRDKEKYKFSLVIQRDRGAITTFHNGASHSNCHSALLAGMVCLKTCDFGIL